MGQQMLLKAGVDMSAMQSRLGVMMLYRYCPCMPHPACALCVGMLLALCFGMFHMIAGSKAGLRGFSTSYA